VTVPDTITIGGDLHVGRIGFGAMRITGEGIWGAPADPAAAREVLQRVVGTATGAHLIDTADSYGPFVSENLIAEALYPYPDNVVIATKGGLTRPGPGVWERNCRPERLKQCCEDSLRRLRLERIDIYQLHAVDPKVPIEDSIGALAELQEEGKIRHAAVCNVTVEELERARAIVEIVSVQNRYNLADRSSEEVLQACEPDGLAFLPWFPLATGELAKPGGAVAEVAAEHGATPAQVALAWLLHHSPVMVPIPGTSSIEHFEENLQARELELTEGDLERLDS
jgi:aryl-alcohol dehydrogenase-like predicted oxidoreductase